MARRQQAQDPVVLLKAREGSASETILKGLGAGWADAKIMAEVARRHPSYKAGPKALTYYRWKLKKAGFTGWLTAQRR